MKISYNWLKDYLKGRMLEPRKLAEILTLHSFEVESVEKKGRDWVLDIDVLPNRAPDCFSHVGVAREIAVLIDNKFQIPNFKFQEEKKIKAKDLIKVEVKDKKDCPRYAAKVILGVKVASSPKWLQERLEVCGLQPINNIVDIANYVMLETGQPIHAFDFEKIEADKRGYQRGLTRKIIVRRAKKGEKIKALDEKTYKLERDILLIADENGPIGIAGIKGGQSTAIDSKTKNIIIETANFDRRIIRRGSQKMRLKTDASWRFENGIDPNLIDFAQKRVASLIQEITGGIIAQGMIDFYPKKIFTKKIKLDLNYTNKLLGVEIPRPKVIKILKSLEFKILNTQATAQAKRTAFSSLPSLLLRKSSVGEDEQSSSTTKYQIRNTKYLLVEIPTRRLDISIQEDLIEEIGRIYGYQKIPSTFPISILIPPKRNLEIFWEDLSKNILKEAGFNEVYNYSFISEKDISRVPIGMGELNRHKSAVLEIENPISADFQYLRPSLIPNLLKNVATNQKFFKEIKIFELGKVFTPLEKFKYIGKSGFSSSLTGFKDSPKESKLPTGQAKEKRMLTGVMTVPGEDGGPAFFEVKGVIDSLLNKMGISNICRQYDEYKQSLEKSKISVWQPKKCAEIKIDYEEIGFLGEISQKILETLKIGGKVVIFDLNFEKLQKIASEEHEYQPISKYPAAIRDLAVLVPQGTKVVEVLNKINRAGGKLVRDVDLFDIYSGEEIAQGKENFAFHIIYQAEDRTLSSKEIDKIHQKIIKALEENPSWEVRK